MAKPSELAGAVLHTGIPGTTLDEATRHTLEEIGPSGVILFRRNIEGPEQLQALTSELHALPSRPLVSIDHEGGRVMRVGAPFTHFPPMRLVEDEDTAQQVGAAIGKELASVGIDIDFAPVLDVDSNPDNPIIGDRAFGRDPEIVSRLALAFARGLQACGVLACGKHFPGHGDTDRDSHLELPTVSHDRTRLDSIELPPFRAAAENNLPMLMTAHVLYPALDPKHPATLSTAILQDLLRGELGYDGVIVSDDLEMRALGNAETIPEAAVQSLRAGCDWLLVCNDFDNTRATWRRLVQAIEAGELEETQLAEKVARVRALPRPPKESVALPCDAHLSLRDRILATA